MPSSCSRSDKILHQHPRIPLPPSFTTSSTDTASSLSLAATSYSPTSHLTTFTDLSDELLLSILRFLDTRSFLRCRRAYRDLLSVSDIDDASCWEYSHFQPRQLDVFLASLSSFDYLKSLDLSLLLGLTDAQLHTILLYCSELTAIDLSCCWSLSNRGFLSPVSSCCPGRLHSIAFPTHSTHRLDSVAVHFPCTSHTGLTSIELSGCSWLVAGQPASPHQSQLAALSSPAITCGSWVRTACRSFVSIQRARRKCGRRSPR